MKEHSFGDQQAIPCSIFRGGTSKGVLFQAKYLPKARPELTALLLRVMGSPDPRQIDGLGGADPLTSRVGIIQKSQMPDVDIEYQFAFVHIKDAIVDFEGFCGNILAASGPFAINEGLIPITEPITKVKIFDTNTKIRVQAEVSVESTKAQTRGNFNISGVPHPGAPIFLHLHDPSGKCTGSLLPTGRSEDELLTSFGKMRVSLIDCVDPIVFIEARAMGLSGNETPLDLDRNEHVLEKLEEVRQLGAQKMGIPCSAFLPKVVFVAPSRSAVTNSLSARMLALRKMHKSYAVSSAACTAAAAWVPGSIVHRVARPSSKRIVIHHPLGTIEVEVEVAEEGKIEKISLVRTARCLMRGEVMVAV